MRSFFSVTAILSMTLAALPIASASFNPFNPFDYLAATFYVGRHVYKPSHVLDCRGGGKHTVPLQNGTLLTVTDQSTQVFGNCTADASTCSVNITVDISQVVDVDAGTTYYLIKANNPTPSISYTECEGDSCTTVSSAAISATASESQRRYMARDPNNNLKIPGLPNGWPFWPTTSKHHTTPTKTVSSTAAVPTPTGPNTVFAYLNQTLSASAYCSAVAYQSCNVSLTIQMDEEFQLQNNATYYLIPNSQSSGFDDPGSTSCSDGGCVSIAASGAMSGSSSKGTDAAILFPPSDDD